VIRIVCFLCGCALAATVTAAEVEVFTTARPVKPKIQVASLVLPARALPVTLPAPEPKRAVAIAPLPPAPSPSRVATPVRTVAPSRVTTSARIVAPTHVATPARAVAVAKPTVTRPTQFTYKDRTGKVTAAPIVDRYQARRIIYPLAKVDPHLSPKLTRAASIAQERAHAHSKSRCWRYVKNALLASGIISSYPKSAYAKQAGEELVRVYGFKKLPIRDPYAAPIGAVLVYGSRRAAGHVEIRTKTGFVSDFQNKKPSPRPLIGIYAKA